jgi:hypothetical protein
MLYKTRHLAGFDRHLALSSRSRTIANEKEIAPMSTVQERIQENEHRLILERQSLAHMENSSWRHMSDLYSALGGVTDPSTQRLSLYERTIEQLKVGIDELEETYNVILRREAALAEAPDLGADQGLRLVDSRGEASHNATMQQASSLATQRLPVIASRL